MDKNSLAHQLSMALDKVRRTQKYMKKAVHSDEEPVFLLLHFAHLSKDGSVPVSALKEAMDVSAAAATQFVKRLEKCGYVTRETDQNDHRIVMVTLTELGKLRVSQTIADFEKALTGLVNALGPHDVAIFIDLLNRTSAYLEKELNS
jgi:DNA-binding MarR family transcriptional regulator